MKSAIIGLTTMLIVAVGAFFYNWQYVTHRPPIFTTLTQLKAYAATMEEYPTNDSLAWADPSFATFWHKQRLSWSQRLAYAVRLKERPLWNPMGFKQLMKQATLANEESGYMGRFVVKMKPVAGSSFVLWGDVQGAFHSLVRALTYLESKHYINDQLEIIKPYVYFVFNGELVNRGAYSLEVLTVVMRLMQKNPGRIFYLRGQNEDVGHWKNFNLKNELMIRIGSRSLSEIPLGNKLDRFFNTLPLALYLLDKEDEKSIDVVRISPFDRKAIELDEEKFAAFFRGPNSSVPEVFILDEKSTDQKIKINVRAIIEGENRTAIYRPTAGLVQIEADKGATAWTLLSSPTDSFRYLQDFYFDAIAILDIGKQLNDWTITLYNQDVRELLGMNQAGIYNFVSGLRDYKKEASEQKLDIFGKLLKQSIALDQEIASVKESCPAADH